ncbi:hypothetical protein TCAL_11102 [Tigriopus californicus]|uniref:Uncharacterized protein n=1 Tax=Tigriopus californicus TaxID=6832 RepID=A0A553NZW2_TIGCA|nr:hypothetical protein TCAL_11102 [Tigriopus californicus]
MVLLETEYSLAMVEIDLAGFRLTFELTAFTKALVLKDRGRPDPGRLESPPISSSRFRHLQTNILLTFKVFMMVAVATSFLRSSMTAVRMIREQLHTEGFGDVGNANKIQAQFQAVVVNAGLDENWSYQNGGTHYITVGIQYGDEFLWIGQASFIVDLKNQDYDFAVNIESGPIDTDKTSFMKGKGYIFTIRANVVEPVADVALQVFQPLGYNDVFHIGHIQRRMGNAFACSPQDGWQDKYSLSPSDLTVNNASIFYSFLVNREAQRDISNDANEIVFLVPVHVMNIDSLPPGVNRTLSFVLQVGKEKIWTTLEERPISDQPLTLSNGVTPTFLSVRLLNNVTSNQIPKGDSIVFLVELRCPKSAYCKFDVELLSSANGQPRIINGGTIAYFSPPWSVYANQDENVVVSFGKVENPASEDTDVSLELTYALDPTADDAHLIELVNPKIGGLPIVLPKDLKASIAEPLENDVVVDLVTPNEAQVVALEGNPSTCEIGEKIWIGYNITVPRGKTIKMEVSATFNLFDTNPKLVSLQAALLLPSENNRALFHAVDVKFDTCNGKNVLCMNPSIDLQRTFPTTFLKSSNITTFMQRDIVTIDFGYVTNAGLSFKQGLYDGDLDDTFSLRFLIQKSDHQIWDRNMDRPIQCSIKFGDVATVVESWIGFEISKLKEEQGQMFITSNLSEPSKQYENGDTIYVQSVIKHDEMSTREGYPTFIQVIVPHYLTYKENSDSFLTNYSSIGNDEIVTVTVANTSGILFQFPQGISFPDIVELNFSLSVEMDGKRPIGSGVESSAIVFAPICFHSGHNKTNSSVSNCGSLRALPFESCAPGGMTTIQKISSHPNGS